MAKKHSARRYARAAFELALKQRKLDEWQAGLEQVKRLAEDKEIMAYLESPDIRFEDKTGLLAKQMGDAGPLVLNLVYLLLERGAVSILPEVVEEYRRLLDEHRNIERAVVTTAVALDAEDEKKLARQLGDITGKQVIIEHKLEPELIGGVVVRVGGKLMDGSTRGRLEALKRELG
jgi:F-type H+-transporting ATPase subunit delta